MSDVIVGLTLGDPAGVGPEVAAKAVTRVQEEEVPARLRVYGPEQFAANFRELDVDYQACGSFDGVQQREPTLESGKAALAALERAIADAASGEIQSLATAPISKQAIALAGSPYRGHTEMLRDSLAAGPVAMSFFADSLRVVLVTTHQPLREALGNITQERIVEVGSMMHRALSSLLDIPKPTIAIAGINPHAGEAGLLGSEERSLIQPAVAQMLRAGVHAVGPVAADTVFHRAKSGEFDGVVAMYHDQGLIPVKLLGVGAATNVTLGLRVPRTSPDHGTAYDIAGRGVANPGGMLRALHLAITLARRYEE